MNRAVIIFCAVTGLLTVFSLLTPRAWFGEFNSMKGFLWFCGIVVSMWATFPIVLLLDFPLEYCLLMPFTAQLPFSAVLFRLARNKKRLP